MRQAKGFSGRSALVTGGASGIGAATATALAVRGASVLVADVNEAAGREVARAIGGEFLSMDVSDPDAWAEVPDVDLAHLNAGLPTATQPIGVGDLTIENWRRVRGVNLDGVVLGVLSLVDGMVRRGGGAFVCTSSGAGLGVFAPDPLYAATKHGVNVLARSIAPLLSPLGITINVVCPSRTQTAVAGDATSTGTGARLTATHVGEVIAAVLAGETEGRPTGEVYWLPPDGSVRTHEFRGELGPPPS